MALVGAGLAAVDVVAGLSVEGGYTLRLAYLHLALVIVGVAGVVAGAWQWSRGQGSGVLVASCALLLGAQLPWSLAGAGGRPWFAVAGIAAALPLAASLALLSAWSPPALERWPVRFPVPQPPRERPRVRDLDGARLGAGPSAPGWYPDPDADASPCWRWWDGRGWTDHRSSGAAG
ncbi:MAG: DUF2510 domain-containing protein [Solirubrobacteraceae bacterium]|nr:DUF2510 domain-containing protein [Solirubrobacteraceae bacterium]